MVLNDRIAPTDKKPCSVNFAECKDLYNQLGRHINAASYKADFWPPHFSMKKKLTNYQKHWKALRAHILKVLFYIPDAQEHKENGGYMTRIGKKDLQEIVVDLRFKQKDLELSVLNKQIWSCSSCCTIL